MKAPSSNYFRSVPARQSTITVIGVVFCPYGTRNRNFLPYVDDPRSLQAGKSSGSCTGSSVSATSTTVSALCTLATTV